MAVENRVLGNILRSYRARQDRQDRPPRQTLAQVFLEKPESEREARPNRVTAPAIPRPVLVRPESEREARPQRERVPAPAVVRVPSSREAWEQSTAQALQGISGRAGAGPVGPVPDLFAGISGRAGVGLATGPTLPSVAGVTGVAGVGEIPRPAPLDAHAYGRAGVGLVTPAFGGGRLPTAPTGVSGRAGVGLVAGPAAPRMTAAAPPGTTTPTTAPVSTTAVGGTTARVLAEENAQIANNISSYTDAAYRAALGALASGERPSAEGVDMQTLEALSREHNRPMVLLGDGINHEQLDALAAQIAQQTGLTGLTGEELLIVAGYKQTANGNWVASNALGVPGSGYGGGGGGGYYGFRYPSYGGGGGGGGGSRGYASEGSPLVNWRVRFSA